MTGNRLRQLMHETSIKYKNNIDFDMSDEFVNELAKVITDTVISEITPNEIEFWNAINETKRRK